MFIYAITNDVNEKAYIGLYSGQELRIRWIRHKSSARHNSRLAIHRAMRKYGIEKFHITCIWSGHFQCSKKEALEKLGALERYYIRCFQTKGPLGYNSADGGTVNAGFKHTEETKAKLRAKVVSAESRAKMSAIHKGKTISEAHKQANREKLKGNKHLLGYFPSPETRKKISAAGMGRVQSQATRAKRSATIKALLAKVTNQ
jgi:group I intron endonuclease